MSALRTTSLLLLTTTAVFFTPTIDGKIQDTFGISVAIAQSAPPSPNTREGSHWLSAVDYYNEAQAAIGRMQMHPEGTWQYASAKKNYDHYVMRYIQFAGRAGATVTADTHPSSVFHSPQAVPPAASTTPNEEEPPQAVPPPASTTPNEEEPPQAVPPPASTTPNEEEPGNNPTGKSHPVSNPDSLNTVINRATCGETIILANGSYNKSFDIATNCDGKAPLVIRSAEPLGAVVGSSVSIRGKNILLTGLYFLGRNARLTVGGENNRVTGNKFEGWSSSVALALAQGRNAEIAYNEFTRPDRYTGTNEAYPLRIAIRSSHRASDFHYSAHIHHNHFYDFPAKPDPRDYHSGQNDAIEVCYTGSQAQPNWLIEYNLIENHRQGHAILDVKCSAGTTVQFNTILDSPGGRMDFRNGDGGKMIANWIENSGGIAIHGDRHEIDGNVLRGSGNPRIMLVTGKVSSNGKLAETQSANFNTLTCNRGNHEIGVWNMRYPARDNVVNGPIGQVNLRKETGTRINMNANCDQIPVARRLGSEEVGLSGLHITE